MKRVWLIVGIAVIALAGLAGCAPGAGPVGPAVSGSSLINFGSQQTGLWSNGMGQVQAVPDIAQLSLGVQAQAKTVADAQSQAINGMNGVMTALTSAGVATKDIQTQNFNITQLTRYDQNTQQNVILGYQVTNTVNAKIRALDKVGSIIDAVVKAGGDVTRINGISFTVENPAPYTKEARQMAMADAKAKADQMAASAGVKLGAPSYITESSYQPPVPSPIFRSGAAAAAPETPISPGQLTITVNVQIVYPIQ